MGDLTSRRIGWLWTLAWAAVAAAAWWLALVHYQTETLAVTAASVIYVLAADAIFGAQKVRSSLPLLIISIVPVTISLGAGSVAAVWLIAMVV